MRIIPSWRGVDQEARGATLALGNFDGVHLGHQAVLQAAREGASGAGLGDARLAVVTFEPHPRELFRPRDPAFRLTSAEAKARALRALGVELLFDLPFDAEFASMGALGFIHGVLLDGFGARHVACGADFRFGHGRRGDVALLSQEAASRGVGVTVARPRIDATGEVISSSSIRDALRAGDCQRAARLLGRVWEIEGEVLAGHRLGRTLGYPTANLALGRSLVPRLGVYAVRVAVADRVYGGVASLGLRPTVNPLPEPLLEAHLFEFEGDLYGQRIRVGLVEHLRNEARFDGLEALVEAMHADAAQARSLL